MEIPAKPGGMLSSMIHRTMNLVLATAALIGLAGWPSAERANP